MRSQKQKPNCSIVIPAFNEAGTIGTTLACLMRGAWHDEFDVIVVCNGCVDDTRDVARKAAPNARILDLEKASKTAALNTGIAAAKHSSIVLLDADIKTSANAVRMLVRSLKSASADLAYGNAHFNTRFSSWPVRVFYRAWLQNPYFNKHKVGGFFAVSLSGLNRIGEFPETTNDDEYVRRKLMQNSVFVRAAYYVVEAPRTLGNLLRVRSRVYRGNAQLADVHLGLNVFDRLRNAVAFSKRVIVRPGLWVGAVVFVFVAIAAHLRNRFDKKNTVRWERDHSTRTSALGLSKQ